MVKFIIPQSVERVQEQESQISDLISVITGGQAIIQVRQGVDCRIQEQESQISDLISVITGGRAIIQVRQGVDYRIQEQSHRYQTSFLSSQEGRPSCRSGRGWTVG